MSFEIEDLADNINYIEEVSKWIYEEWEKVKGAKIEDIIYRTKHSLIKDNIPNMFIAIYNNQVIGVVSLWRNDLTSRQDLCPYMATLFVKEEYRNKGVGRKLQEKCIDEARRLGYHYLYLITDHKNYYEKIGWTFLEEAPLNDGNYTRIYQYKL